jgi:hypothetical protein
MYGVVEDYKQSASIILLCCVRASTAHRCSICPFMIYGEVMQRWRMAQGVVLRKWPREESE